VYNVGVSLSHEDLHSVAAAIARTLREDASVAGEIRVMLQARGVPSGIADAALNTTLDALAAVLRDAIEAALPHVLREDEEYLAAIRRFLLEPQETYRIEDLAALWRIPIGDVRDLYHDELARWSETHPAGALSLQIEWADAVGAGTTFHLLRPYDVERALGGDFNRVRPDAWRTIPVLVRLPRFIVETLQTDWQIGPAHEISERVEHFILELFEGEHRRAFEAVHLVDVQLPPPDDASPEGRPL
jgi:hypothetical protein